MKLTSFMTERNISNIVIIQSEWNDYSEIEIMGKIAMNISEIVNNAAECIKRQLLQMFVELQLPIRSCVCTNFVLVWAVLQLWLADLADFIA